MARRKGRSLDVTHKTVIQAIPERLEMAEELAAATGGEIVLQKPGEDVDQNHINTLSKAGDVDYLIRLEDDVIVAPDWHKVIPDILETMKDQEFAVCALYTNHDLVLNLMPEKGHVITPMLKTSHLSAVGLIYDANILPVFLEWYPNTPWEFRQNPFHRLGAPDHAIAVYLREHGLSLCAVTPCIIQHRNTPSFLGGDCRMDRQSFTYRKRYGDKKLELNVEAAN